MAGELTLTLSGEDYNDLQKKLSKLSALEQDAVVKKGLQEGVKVIAVEGRLMLKKTMSTEPSRVFMRKRMAEKRGGSLEKSIGTRVVNKKGKAYAGFGKHGRHAHLVDTGTVQRFTKKGYNRGKVVGSRFWRTSFEAKRKLAMQELMDSIITSIKKIGK